MTLADIYFVCLERARVRIVLVRANVGVEFINNET